MVGASLPVGLAVAKPIVANRATLQASPNPFSDYTQIQYELTERAPVSLKIMDVMGRVVAVLVDNELHEAGAYEKAFPTGALSSGLYLCTLQAGDKQTTLKLALRH